MRSSIVGPQVEIVEQRAARRQILRDRTPPASRTQNIHDAVHHFPHIHVPPVAAAFGRWNQSFDVRPLVVSQVTRIPQMAAVITLAVHGDPPRIRPPPLNHKSPGQTLRAEIVFKYTLIDEYLTVIICHFYFSVVRYKHRRKAQRMR